MTINKNLTFAGADRMKEEFGCIEKYLYNDDGKMKKGVDIGCGTNRLSMEVLALDQNPDRRYSHAEIAHDCKNLDVQKLHEFNGYEYKFENNELDFIFSSHCLEDFEDIPMVFKNWWDKLKDGGLMILLLPDMEPCNCETCMSDDQVKYRKSVKMSARYWTIEDYEKHGRGNPSHKTNVGKKFINSMLENFHEKSQIGYEVLQQDTIAHDKSSTVDFVIKKLK